MLRRLTAIVVGVLFVVGCSDGPQQAEKPAEQTDVVNAPKFAPSAPPVPGAQQRPASPQAGRPGTPVPTPGAGPSGTAAAAPAVPKVPDIEYFLPSGEVYRITTFTPTQYDTLDPEEPLEGQFYRLIPPGAEAKITVARRLRGYYASVHAFRLGDGRLVRVIGSKDNNIFDKILEDELAAQKAAGGGTAAAADSDPSASSPAADPNQPVTTDLGDRVTQIVPGGRGRYLLLSMPNKKQVAVYDVRTDAIVKNFDVGSNEFMVAGGATRFVVADSANKQLIRVSYAADDDAVLKKPYAFSSYVKLFGVVMGDESEGPLYFSYRKEVVNDDNDTERHHPFVVPIDLQTLKPEPYKITWKSQAYQFSRMSEPIDETLICSPDGRKVFSQRGPASITYTRGALLLEDLTADIERHSGDLFPNADGSMYFQEIWVVPTDGPTIKFDKQKKAKSCAQPAYWMTISENVDAGRQVYTVGFHVQQNVEPFTKLLCPRAPIAEAAESDKDLKFQHRFFYDVREKKFIAVNRTGRRMISMPFDIRTQIPGDVDLLMVATKGPPSFARSKKLNYQIGVEASKPPVNYRLESGPPGMTVSPTGLVEWTPGPKSLGIQTAIIGLTSAAGKQVFHDLHMTVALPGTSEFRDALWDGAKAAAALNASTTAGAQTPTAPPAQVDAGAAEAATAVNLPGKIDDVSAAAGGRYLLVVMKDLQSIAVVDVADRKIVKTLKFDDGELLVAGGARKFAVVENSKKILSRWDLATLTREASTPLPDEIVALAMGAASEGPIVGSSKTNNLAALPFDLATLKPIVLPEAIRRKDLGYRIAASADGRTIVGWRDTQSLSGLSTLDFGANPPLLIDTFEEVRSAALSADGQTIYTLRGLYGKDCRPIAGESETHMIAPQRLHFPALTGGIYLDVPAEGNAPEKTATAVLRQQGDGAQLATFNNLLFPDKFKEFDDREILFEKRLMLLPQLDVAVVLPKSNDRLVIQKLDLEKTIAAATEDYLFVTSPPPPAVKPGDTLQYLIDVRSRRGGVKFKLDSGPAGMTVSPQGLIVWKAPPLAAPTPPTIVSIEDASGRQSFLTFQIAIVNDAPPIKPIVDLPHPEVVKIQPAPGDAPSAGGASPANAVSANAVITVAAAAPRAATAVPTATARAPTTTTNTPTAVATPAAPEPTTPAAPTGPASDRPSLKLPGPVDDLCIGGDGTYLVAYMKATKQIAVVDLVGRRVTTYIPIDDDFVRVAAGKSKFVVYKRGSATLSRYALATGQRELIVSVGDASVSRVVLGAASEGPVVLVPPEYSHGQRGILDLATLKLTKLPNVEPLKYLHLIDEEARISSDGGTICSSRDIFSLRAAPPSELGEGHHDLGAPIPTADGRFLCSGDTFLTRRGERTASGNQSFSAAFIPAVSGPLVLKVPLDRGDQEKAVIELYVQGQPTPLTSLPNVKRPPSFWTLNTPNELRLEQRFFFIPGIKALVTVPESKDELQFQKFVIADVVAEAKIENVVITSSPPLLIPRGETLSYQIEIAAKQQKVKYRLASGPEGMTVSPEGIVSWAVPKSPKTTPVKVDVRITDSADRETTHAFELLLVKTD